MEGEPAAGLEALQQACPAAFYKPNTPAPDSWIVAHGGAPGSRSLGDSVFFESLASRRLAIGGNRSAKSTKMVLEAGSFCVGCRPWYPPDSPWFTEGLASRVRDKRVRVRFVVTNFETQLEEIMDELRKWWPSEWWSVVSRNQHGHPNQIDWFPSHSGPAASWFFMSHRQSTADFEGIETDLVVWNEPPPRDKWTALHRGLVSSGGRSITGATPLTKSDWFWEEIITPNELGHNPDYFISYHSIWDNTHENGGYENQKCNAVRIFLDEITDPLERSAREHGAPMHLAGIILSNCNPPEHVIEPFDLPFNCLIASAIDPAGTRPYAGLHIAYVPDDVLGWKGYIFDETLIRGLRTDLAEFARTWNLKESGSTEFGPYHPHPSTYTLIDPIASEVQKADDAGRSLRDILAEDYGLNTIKANKHGKRARLMQLNTRFRRGHYYIFNTCRQLVTEVRRWSWDPDSPKLTAGPDDMCDCLSYIDITDPFRMLQSHPNERAGGIYIPGEINEFPWRELKEKKEREKWRYLAKHGLKTL